MDAVRPLDAIEIDLVHDMAIARWRKMRLLEFEAALLTRTIDQVQAELGGESASRIEVHTVALGRLLDDSKTWNTLQRYIKDAERTYNTCLKQLLTVPARRPEPAQRKNEPNPAPPPKPLAVVPQQPNPSRFGKGVPLRPNGYPVNLALAL
jgi:hypothetical protein